MTIDRDVAYINGLTALNGDLLRAVGTAHMLVHIDCDRPGFAGVVQSAIDGLQAALAAHESNVALRGALAPITA